MLRSQRCGQVRPSTTHQSSRCDLKSRGSQQQLLADFEDYLNGFSPNVQDILDNFEFRNQLSTACRRHGKTEAGTTDGV
jgi:hypothetical protein